MQFSDTSIIFIHGNNGGEEPGGKGSDYWFPWAVVEFEKRGFRVAAPDFPDPMIAHKDIWLPFIENECGADENSILIGHSSGAIAAQRYTEHHKILGSVLVGTYETDLDDKYEKLSGYFDEPWNWDAQKTNQNFIIQFASTDDPYIPVEESHAVRDYLNPTYIEYTDRGHFFDDTFPELIEEVLRILELPV